MLLSEARQILKKNGYMMVEAVSNEVLKKVTQRTKDHITRVKHFYKLLANAGIIGPEYVRSISTHDSDKLEPENLRRQALRYCTDPDEMTDEIEEQIQDVVREHVKSNKHHCEYWGSGDHRTKGMDCTKMPLTYVYEMMADWAATAEERGRNC